MEPSDPIRKPIKVQVQILPWLSGLVGGQSDEEVVFGLSLHQDATLQQFLDELSVLRPEVAALVYDQDNKAVRQVAVLLLNNRAFELAGGYDAVMKDGDIVTLLAAYSGG